VFHLLVLVELEVRLGVGCGFLDGGDAVLGVGLGLVALAAGREDRAVAGLEPPTEVLLLALVDLELQLALVLGVRGETRESQDKRRERGNRE
jgi:hypothetical protein